MSSFNLQNIDVFHWCENSCDQSLVYSKPFCERLKLNGGVANFNVLHYFLFFRHLILDGDY